ncbi:MAG: Pullulanase precursor [bacterium ADurb.Bin243]|nr:MAG: Pullulanase precursor [bacterium ADurb.Bin243]
MKNLVCKRFLALLLISFLSFFTFSYASAQQQSDGLTKALDNLARDISQSSNNLVSGGEAADMQALSDAVFSRLEDVSLSEIRSFIDSVNNAQQIDYVLESAASFAAANQKLPYVLASIKTIKMLNDKTKFLMAQSPDQQELIAVAQKAAELTRKLSSQKNTLARSGVEAISKNVTVSSPASVKSQPKAASKLKQGANFYPETSTTTFALNAPRAASVKLVLFDSADAKTGKEYEMKKTAEGMWYLAFNQNLTGKYYGYYVDGPKGKGERFDPKHLLSDPYAYANDGSYGKSVVVSDTYKWKEADFKTPAAKDLVVYEMHIKSYTSHASAGVSADKRGKYLGLLEGADSEKILGNLKALGVNAVELLPVHEFDNKAAPSGVNYWGYMTTHFMAPESSYATASDGRQVTELKKLIDGLHANGIAVILDVVYNHTAEGNEQGPAFNFKGIDNREYYRLCDNPDFYWNGTGCGNEFRTDSQMGRRYVLETLMHWVKEYKVDGFRFDLATIIDKETMTAINDTLPKNVILIAEPWAADWNRNQWSKGDFRNTRWAKWNDDFKNNVRNFASGRANRDNMMTLICGTCYWWAAKPTETVNFVECHDNATMMDACGGNQKIAMLAGLITLTSQGIPMLHEGQEFLKTKFGNDNSYDQDNEINHIDWSLKAKNKKAFDFFSGVVKIRHAYPQFRNDRPLTDKDIKWMLVDNNNGLGYQLFGKESDVIVLLNGDQNNWIKFALPDDKEWKVLCNGTEASPTGVSSAKGDYSVPPISGVILARKK